MQMLLTPNRTIESKARTENNWKVVRLTLPDRNQSVLKFKQGQIPVVGLNRNHNHNVFEGAGVYGRISANYRQVVKWGFTEATLYDCSAVNPGDVRHAILDGDVPRECKGCPLLYREEHDVFCPVRVALRAYQLRKELETNLI